jgi:hypothetical protein
MRNERISRSAVGSPVHPFEHEAVPTAEMPKAPLCGYRRRSDWCSWGNQQTSLNPNGDARVQSRQQVG